MKYTGNINLPIVESGDLYSKEINNLAFNQIDEHIQGLRDAVTTLDDVDGSILETKEEVKSFSSQLDTKANKDKLGYYVVDELPNFDINDISICINQALAEGKHIKLLSKRYYIKNPILLKNESKISGYGRKTQIRLLDGYSSEIITLENSEVRNVSIDNFCIFGNIDNHGDTKKTAMLINNGTQGDCKHNINNIDISNWYGNGFSISGSGEGYIENIRVVNCDGKGIIINTIDNFYNGLSSGVTTDVGIYIDGNSNRIINSKAWYGTTGIYLKGSRNQLSNCEMQDNLNLGLEVIGWENKLDIYIDTVGTKDGSITVSGATGIKLNDDCGRNRINGLVGDRKGYVQSGTLDYVLSIGNGATGNEIYLTCNSVKVSAIKENTYKASNTIEIKGSKIDYTLIRHSSYTGSGSIELVGSFNIEENNLHKERNICQIKYKINSISAISSNTKIGRVQSGYEPIVYSGIPAMCYDGTLFKAMALADIDTDGYITLYDMPTSITRVSMFGTYISKEKL